MQGDTDILWQQCLTWNKDLVRQQGKTPDVTMEQAVDYQEINSHDITDPRDTFC